MTTKLNVGIICCDIDHLDRVIRKWEQIHNIITSGVSACDSDNLDLASRELDKEIETIKDQVEYFKELNKDIPRIPKTF
jgi:hypothetical protein